MASGSSFAPLVLESRRGSVSTITLNRPDRLNALNNALGQALLDALNGAMRDHSVRTVVLTGAGRGFCAAAAILTSCERLGNAKTSPKSRPCSR